MNNTVPIKRWNILKKVIDGEVTLKTASLQMGVSYRQAVRMKQSVMKDGIRGLIHGNTGRRPANALEETLKSKILDWSRNGYGGLTDTSFVETLEKDKGVKISRETARKIRRSGGIQPGKARRQPRQTVTAGRPREGLSIFWDGMIHQWFAREPYACCLLAAIDDASGRCLAARFFPFEESLAYLFILQTVVRECGIPEKIIQDCNPLLLRNDTDWSIDEQLQGKQEPTQVGNAMQDFSIEPVFVRTKRQQRYFERIFELFHICLLEELQQQQIADLPDGNAFLETSFIHSFNQAYALQSETIGQSWRPVAAQMDVEQVCSFRYKGRKNSNNTVKVGDVNIPLHDTTANRLRPGSNHIDVRQLLDGSWRIYSQDTVIGEHPPTPLREPVRMKVKPQRKTTRAASLTWTYPGGS